MIYGSISGGDSGGAGGGSTLGTWWCCGEGKKHKLIINLILFIFNLIESKRHNLF